MFLFNCNLFTHYSPLQKSTSGKMKTVGLIASKTLCYKRFPRLSRSVSLFVPCPSFITSLIFVSFQIIYTQLSIVCSCLIIYSHRPTNNKVLLVGLCIAHEICPQGERKGVVLISVPNWWVDSVVLNLIPDQNRQLFLCH